MLELSSRASFLRPAIPVFHDDQHGTAIIAAAGLVNSLELQDKKIEDINIVCIGAGAAGVATLKLLMEMGAKNENIYVLDRNGVIHSLLVNMKPNFHHPLLHSQIPSNHQIEKRYN